MKMSIPVKVALCGLMLVPGGLTFWVYQTHGFGMAAYYGAVCILTFAACGIHYRRSRCK